MANIDNLLLLVAGLGNHEAPQLSASLLTNFVVRFRSDLMHFFLCYFHASLIYGDQQTMVVFHCLPFL